MADEVKEMKKLHIEAFDKSGKLEYYEIEIPATWKVTFGPLSQAGPHVNCMALRIYEAKEKQRACFINVVSFYDKSIPINESEPIEISKPKSSAKEIDKQKEIEKQAERSIKAIGAEWYR